ncbi:MAG: barstar family protein [Lachnospiraceae bacterium]|nr:barstar family protein [Lachnospiraceae bacterium]
MEYILDCNEMTDMERAHEYIAKKLGFPSYYGKNLDALFDCLGEMPEGCSVILENVDSLYNSLGSRGTEIVDVFGDAANEGFIDLDIY